MKNKRGVFITFEGIDGSGKTTQIEKLREFIKSLGMQTVFTREPGGTRIGDYIRDLLLNPENKEISARTEAFLFLASRVELVEKVILPGLDSGKVVICDRFFDSTIAYQGIARGLGIKDIYRMSLWATQNLEPDITFLLSLNVNESELRLDRQKEKKRDRIEFEENNFKEKIQDGYLQIAKKFNNRFIVIDASLDVDSIFNQVRNHTLAILKKRGLI